MHELIAPAINLSILLTVLGYYLRAPLKDFVASRHVTLRDEVQRVRKMLREAQEQFDEFSAKLKAIDAEVMALKDQAKQDAQVTKNRIVTEAMKLSENVVVDARATATAMFSELKGRLTTELGFRVLDRAESILREKLTGADQARIRQEFSKQVENFQ